MILSTTVRSLVSRLRALVRHLWVYALHLSGALARAKSRIRADEGAVVLTLHRVLPDRERGTTLSPPGMVMSEQTFASMVRYLAAEHRVFPLMRRKSRYAPTSESPLPSRLMMAGLITRGMPSAFLPVMRCPRRFFFVPRKWARVYAFWPERLVAFFRAATHLRREKEFLDVIRECAHLPERKVIAQADELVEVVKQLPARRRNLLFERLEQLGFGKNLDNSPDTDSTMSWEEARRLSESGFLLGSHTLHHEILTRIPLEETCEEIIESRRRLNLEIGPRCFAFAYPNGDWSPEIRELTASAGYAMHSRISRALDSTDRSLHGAANWSLGGCRYQPSRTLLQAASSYAVFWKTLREARKAIAGTIFQEK